MDLWTYLRSFARWWWLALAFPIVGFLLAWFILFPSAPYQSSWTVFMGFNDNPSRANSFAYVDYIVLDDIGHLLQSDVAGDVVYLNLPESVTSDYSRDEVGEMFSSFRHARFVEIFVTGEDRETVKTVAETTEDILAMTVNEYLIPPDNPNYPGVVETMNPVSEPQRLTRERLQDVAGVTLAAGAFGLIAVGVAEWLRQASGAKNGER